MERVRAKAQSAIDQANTAYSQQRTVLMARFDALVTYLSQQQAAAQQQRMQAAATTAPQPATGGGDAVAPAGGTPMQLHAGLAKAAVGEGQAAAAAAAAAAANNPMHMLSHAMASQILSLQAGMAQAAAAAGKPGAASLMPPQAAVAAAAAAAAAQGPLNAAFAQFCAMPEADLRAQVCFGAQLTKARLLFPSKQSRPLCHLC
jgi:hypothetical protein